jgi:hypothetical protein
MKGFSSTYLSHAVFGQLYPGSSGGDKHAGVAGHDDAERDKVADDDQKDNVGAVGRRRAERIE